MTWQPKQCGRDYPHMAHGWMAGRRAWHCQGVAEESEIRFYNGEIVVVKK